ncbi:hypothetical protein [Streptococcus merionis]|uniref:Uncharacterized protein n=1 Tax=Streptococcus merionis TaxID=400065 RepID=A0A239SXK2_9STRE|nr:hypothetical protein [Streptococcus merionis]SNU90177.1 Uncharacterised protein [Streptococcus merionis]
MNIKNPISLSMFTATFMTAYIALTVQPQSKAAISAIWITVLFQFFIGLCFAFVKFPDKKEQARHPFNLTSKVYLLTTLTASSIYTVGIWLTTPATNPSWLKSFFLGVGLLILLGLLLYYSLKPARETPDERFHANLSRAALSLLLLILLLTLAFAIFLCQSGPKAISAGLVLIVLGALCLLFGIFFFIFETRN